MNCVSLTLPVQPLPLSQCFVNKRRGGRQSSEAYDKWKQTVDAHLVKFHAYALGTPYRPAVIGRVKVVVTVLRPDNRRRDLDNLGKCCGDLLTRNYVIADDSYIEDWRIKWSHDLAHPAVIEIESIFFAEVKAA